MQMKFLVLMLSLSGCVYTEFPQDNATDSGLSGPGLDGTETDRFLLGRSLFELEWSPQEVGPVFNASACAECHVDAGRAEPTSVGLLFRLSAESDSALPDPVYGSQLQPRGLRNAPGEGRVIVTHEDIRGQYGDGTSYVLQRPRYQIVDLGYGPASETLVVSPRLAPQLAGLGLLESIPTEEILALVDPQDFDRDGVSGQANMVIDAATGKQVLGRFGWKAGQPTVRQQNAAAFAGDLGMTSSLFANGPCTELQELCQLASFDIQTELSDFDLDAVTHFTRLLAPLPSAAGALETEPGYAIFEEIGCSSCHVAQWTTGPDVQPELANREIRPFTDLLLHDMGEALADHRPEGVASGVEWRTPPLWGIGQLQTGDGHQDLLHDGRARNVEEAILWHAGEGESAVTAFKELSAGDRARLVEFVNAI